MQKKSKSPEGVKSLIRSIEGVIEILCLTVLYYQVWRYAYQEGLFPLYYGRGKFVLAGIYALLTTAMFFNYDGFKFGYLKRSDALVSQLIALLIVNFITYWQLCLIANSLISPVPILILMVMDVVVAIICCVIYDKLYHKVYIPKKMVMIFGQDNAVTLKFKMDVRSDKYQIAKLIPDAVGLKRICEEVVKYDAVIINDVSAELRNDVLKFCYDNQIRTYVVPKISDIIVQGAENINLFDTPLMLVKGKGLNVTQRVCKRAMDIAICLVAMIVAAPIMAVTAIAIKLEDGGPVFFTQKRATLDGNEFDILKFRSMIVDAEKEGKSIPATDRDPRITKVGHIIRATRIDELPQILNILKGDMSIVGPRPERLEHIEEYSKEIPEFRYRLKVKGGLTGYAQIYGKYNTSPYDKLRLDLMYIENYSLRMDIKLILMTIRIMLKKDSTEGFDKAEELERLKQEALQELDCAEHGEKLVSAGK